ncbi:hypothetical protein DV735_g4180, partial [Chaetothyriales sp. CBS 134920]
MADPSTDELSTRISGMFLGPAGPQKELKDLQERLISVIRSSPRKHADALRRFLKTEPVKMSPVAAIIPPADELEIRLSHAQKLRDGIRVAEALPEWEFSASGLSTILVMPMDILKKVSNPEMEEGPIFWHESALQLSGELAHQFLSGLSAAPPQDTAPPPPAGPGPYVAVNRRKREADKAYRSWNMLAINRQLHKWWAMGLWALKCLGITPMGAQHTVSIQFHWMPKHSSLSRHRNVSLEDGSVQEMLGSLKTWYGDPDTQPEDGIVAASHAKSHQPLLTGQVFEVKFEGKESEKDAHNMKAMVDLQWALIVMASMAGAADPPDFNVSDSDDSDYGAMEAVPGPMYGERGVRQQPGETETAPGPGRDPSLGPSRGFSRGLSRSPSRGPSRGRAPGKQPDDPPSPSPALGSITNLPPRSETRSPEKAERAQSSGPLGQRRSENVP